MQDSNIVSQVMKIENTNRKMATHFALYNGSHLRYLIDLNGGAKRLSKNISTYSKKLSLLMQFINIIPFSMLSSIKMGYFVKVEFNAEVEACRRNTKKKHWNMIIGTYDEKQKIVLQCFNGSENADFIKIGNAATEKEMNAEISFLKQNRKYATFNIPQLLSSASRADGAMFNIQITKEFIGSKVEPILTWEIVSIYKELSKDTKDGLVFSHGDFAPWNLKKNGDKYTLFDWEHCDYRMPGFDLMHYATIIQKVLNGKELSEAFDEGLKNIQQFLPDFYVEKEAFLTEFETLRTQIS